MYGESMKETLMPRRYSFGSTAESLHKQINPNEFIALFLALLPHGY